MVEIFLRQAGVEQEAVIDDLEIHVGDAPIRIPEAGDEKRSQHPAADDHELGPPRERHETLHRSERGIAGGLRPKMRNRGAKGLHVERPRGMLSEPFYTTGATQCEVRGFR